MSALPGAEELLRTRYATLDRRAFIEACSVVVVALTGCSRALSNARLGRLAINDPPRDEFMPVLRALIPTILPFEHPAFPALAPAVVEGRVLDLFPFDLDPDAANVRRALTIFNDTTLFPVIASPTTADERAANGGGPAALAEKAVHDQALYATWSREFGRGTRETFIALAVEQRRGYLRLWSQSDFIARRHFYQSAKRLVMVAAYTTAELWTAIGYAGPVLQARS